MLKNFNIKMKLFMGIMITIIILLITGSIIFVLNKDVDKVTEELKDEYFLRIEISTHLKEAASDFQRSLELYNLTGEQSYLEHTDLDLLKFELN